MKEFLARNYLHWRFAGGLSRSSRRELPFIIKSIFRQDPRLVSQDARLLLADLEPSISGVENIPKEGPVVFAVNHWHKGPLWTKWYPALINSEVANTRGEEVKWVMQDSINTWIFERKMPLSGEIAYKLARSYGLFLAKNRNVKNSEKEFGANQGMNIVRAFSENGMIGVAPEAGNKPKDGVSWRAGDLIYRLLDRSRRHGFSAYFCPVGAWSDGNILSLNFGLPIAADDFLQNLGPRERSEEFYKGVAQMSLLKINELLPRQYQR